jgi:hypothetical protein
MDEFGQCPCRWLSVHVFSSAIQLFDMCLLRERQSGRPIGNRTSFELADNERFCSHIAAGSISSAADCTSSKFKMNRDQNL